MSSGLNLFAIIVVNTEYRTQTNERVGVYVETLVLR
jgi:hypothetical protein